MVSALDSVIIKNGSPKPIGGAFPTTLDRTGGGVCTEEMDSVGCFPHPTTMSATRELAAIAPPTDVKRVTARGARGHASRWTSELSVGPPLADAPSPRERKGAANAMTQVCYR